MNQRRLSRCHVLLLGLSMLGASITGCREAPKTIPPKYPTLPSKEVPAFLKDTVLERVDLGNLDPFPVSNYALVANLSNTGDSTMPTLVREYMTKELGRHRVPADRLKSPQVAVVRVFGFIAPGARIGQWFDAYVNCLEGNNTSSLVHGTLFQTELKVNGANAAMPGGGTPETWASVTGPLFVNPAYAFGENNDVAARVAKRSAVIMDGGRVIQDRPIVLHLRQPQRSLARLIADRITNHFQNSPYDDTTGPKMESDVSGSFRAGGTAEALDEGVIRLLVPMKFDGDWEHFVGIVRHLYLNGSPEFAALKAKQLAEEAVKPNAPLLDISYCWEGLGSAAVPFLSPLLAHENPDVAFAAARAGAFLRDQPSRQALMDMARTKGHRFAASAVQVLGSIPGSPAVNAGLRELLDSSENVVRLEAYRLLAKRKDASLVSTVVRDRFVLDVVQCKGTPLIYATRQGVPRIAILAPKAEVDTPLTFTTFGMRLSISSGATDNLVSIFYRGEGGRPPVQIKSGTEASELIARLGGEGVGNALNFNYGDVVAILQAMADARKLVVPNERGQAQPLTFVLQDASVVGDAVDMAKPIPEDGGSRPQNEDEAERALDRMQSDSRMK